MRSRTTVEKIVQGLIAGPAKRRFKSQTERKLSVLLEVIGEIESHWKRAEAHNLNTYKTISNAMLFVLLIDLDLTVLLYDQAAEFDDARKNVYSRQLALLLYEGYEDLPSVLGKDFRTSVLTLPSGKQILQNIGALIKRISASATKHSKNLNEIRRLTVAHHDHDAIGQLALIRTINHKQLSNVAEELVVALGELATPFGLLLVEMGKPSVFLHQLARRA